VFRRIGRVPVIVAAMALALAPAASAQVRPYGTNDHGGFRNILPPVNRPTFQQADEIQSHAAR
jgi:hypothetical protein